MKTYATGVFFLLSWDRASLMYSSKTNKMQSYAILFITINALHVSGGSSAHHQELKTVYTASGICRAFSDSYRYGE